MEPFLGQVIMFGGNFAPRGWALCDGQLLPINQNQSLYSLLGTMYGGDGRTTFALPDMRGRVPMSFGTLVPSGQSFVQGTKGGQENVQLTSQQMPTHTHVASARVHGDFEFNCANVPGTSTDPENNFLGSAGTENLYSAPSAATKLMAPKAFELEAQIQVNNNGGSGEHSNMAPYQVVNFIIALTGIFPSRN
ncbi:MAG: phage tail protein [Phaeodactylibacter sp.]|nr:phage tail protein [Phaeodactylibacter sp.]